VRKTGEASHEAIEHEIAGEKAAALGRGGRRVEAALAALRNSAGEERETLIDEAARIVWGFLIQRELLGLRDRDRVIAHYAIPTEVLNRMGAIRT
jgi:hypothetical protein